MFGNHCLFVRLVLRFVRVRACVGMGVGHTILEVRPTFSINFQISAFKAQPWLLEYRVLVVQ